jgi:hypothetical protein
VFVGTRVPFQTLLDYLEAGQPLAQFLDDFPTVSRDQAVAALEQAKEALFAVRVLLDECLSRRLKRFPMTPTPERMLSRRNDLYVLLRSALLGNGGCR